MQKIKNLFLDSVRESKKTRTLVLTALFIAINVAMDALGLRIDITQEVRISFGFLTSAMVGLLFGPFVGMTAGAASDILSFIVHSSGGAYFPGFTLTAMLSGVFYGLGLYKSKLTIWRALVTKTAVSLFLNVCLNSVWHNLLYGKALMVILPLRIGKNLIALPFEVALLFLLGKMVEQINLRSGAATR